MVTTALVAVLGSTTSVYAWRFGTRIDTIDRVAALAVRPALRLPLPVRTRLTVALASAGVGLVPEDAVRAWLLTTAAVGAVLFVDAPLLGAAGAATVLVGGPIGLYTARTRGERRTAAELPLFVEAVASELRAGGTVLTSLQRFGQGTSSLAPEIRRVHARADLGVSLNDALRAWVSERQSASVRAVAGALALASTVGGPAAAALDGLASSLRARLGVVAETRALSAQARGSAAVVALAPLGYLLFAVTVDDRALRVLVGTGIGWLCLAVGLGLELVAAVWMRWLLREETLW